MESGDGVQSFTLHLLLLFFTLCCKYHMGNLSVDWRIILECISEKCGKLSAGFFWLRIGTSDVML
jgi:hypothetical protein